MELGGPDIVFVNLTPALSLERRGRIGREAVDAAGDDVEAQHALLPFLARRQQRLHADADAEEWAAGRDEVERDAIDTGLAERAHGRVERAIAWEDGFVGLADGLGGVGDEGATGADFVERLLD